MYNRLPFVFIGDTRSFSVGGRYPDFVSLSRKTVLEVADKHEKEWRKGLSWQRYESETVAHYAKFGWKCLVLWSVMSDSAMLELLI